MQTTVISATGRVLRGARRATFALVLRYGVDARTLLL